MAQLRESLYDIKVLTAMQLQARGNFKFLREGKRMVYSIAFTLLAFAAATGGFFLFFYLSKRLQIFSLTGNLPSTVASMIFTVLLFFSLTSTTVGVTRSLFLSPDNKLLLTLPTSSTKVFFSKLIVYYILELKKQFLYIAPMFVAFGFVNKYGFAYFPYVFLATIPLSLAVVMAASILSLPTMFVLLFFRKHRTIQSGIFMVMLAGVTTAILYGISKIPHNINIVENFGNYYWQIQDFLNSFASTFKISKIISEMFIGSSSITSGHKLLPLSSLWTCLELLAFSAVGILLNLFVIRVFFVYLASRQFEHKTTRKVKKRNPTLLPFLSSLKKEILIVLRAPGAFFNSFAFLFALPILVYLLNQILNSIDVRYLGTVMGACVNAAIIFVISLTNNLSASTVLSVEGREIAMLKTRPSSFNSTLLAKLTIHVVLMIVSVVTACLLFGKMSTIGTTATVIFTITTLLLNMSHILLSVDLDITNPQYNRYYNGVFDGINRNELLSAIAAFAIAFSFFGIFTFFYVETPETVFLKTFALAAGFFVLRVVLNSLRVKLLLKDI